MKITFGNRRQLGLWGILVLVFILAIVEMRGSGPSVSAPTSSSSAASRSDSIPGEQERFAMPLSRGGRSEKKASLDDVPIITTDDLDPAGARKQTEGRNLFDFRPPTLPPPPTPTPAPPAPPVCGQALFTGPCPPPPPTPTPAPPEVSFKFIGSFGAKEKPVAVLEQGHETVNAREGDIVFQQFIVRKIGYESIDVGFVGRDPKEIRRLGLTP